MDLVLYKIDILLLLLLLTHEVMSHIPSDLQASWTRASRRIRGSSDANICWLCAIAGRSVP